jgi:hypothetical protein
VEYFRAALLDHSGQKIDISRRAQPSRRSSSLRWNRRQAKQTIVLANTRVGEELRAASGHRDACHGPRFD